jgi:hypothetical protein
LSGNIELGWYARGSVLGVDGDFTICSGWRGGMVVVHSRLEIWVSLATCDSSWGLTGADQYDWEIIGRLVRVQIGYQL